MNLAFQRPPLQRILPDLVAFVAALCAAWVLDWQTRDLVWTLWLGSLVIGYLTILSILGGGVVSAIVTSVRGDSYASDSTPGILMETLGALVGIVFFSVHFCGFHAGHAVFLSALFPLDGVRPEVFIQAFANPIRLWKTVFTVIPVAYLGFLIPAVIAERRTVFASLFPAGRSAFVGRSLGDPRNVTVSLKPRPHSLGNAIARPYINVIRMHLLIFFFGFCHWQKIDSFVVYAVVYFVYFFPWRACFDPNA